MLRCRAWLLALVAAVLAAGGALLPTAPAYACSCADASPARAAADAEVIFVGTLLDSVRVRRPAGYHQLRFSVARVHKGTAYAEQVITAHAEPASCGFDPERGSSWLIFARMEPQGAGEDLVLRLATGSCSGNRPVDQGALTPGPWGPGRAPEVGASDEGERADRADETITRWFRGAGMGALALVGVATIALAVMWRARSER